MIIGAHSILYSKDPEADRSFFRDVLEFGNVDVGGGWLIFGLPPSEAAFHPAEESGKQEFIAWMGELQIPCTPIHEEPWGRLTDITLPGGGALGVYEPSHERPGSV